VLRREEAELEVAIHEATSAREDSLPFLITAKEMVDDKILKYVPYETVNLEKRIARDEAKRAKTPSLPTEADSLFFYQGMLCDNALCCLMHGTKYDSFLVTANDGQLIFLHPLNVKWLVLEHGSFSAFPHTLTGKIMDFEDLTQDEVCVFALTFPSPSSHSRTD
jgi:hypothetical protein